jgi:hypothetical protein
LLAFEADQPRNDLTGLDAPPSSIEETTIPADLAEAIARLAAATTRQQAESLRLGDAVATRLGWQDLEPAGH